MAAITKNSQHNLRDYILDMPSGRVRVAGSGLMVSLGYLDACRSAWLPANIIQAQRDYFGAHTFEQIDAKGTFHTESGKP